MSSYYKYKFVSPESIYATVKEELRSYFDTGAIDDLMFPIWTRKCLDKLGRGSYGISEIYLEIDNYVAKLPQDFLAVREAWLCTNHYQSAKIPGAIYTSTLMRITPQGTEECASNSCDGCDNCNNNLMAVTYKITDEVVYQFSKQYLLKPGNVSRLKDCSFECGNYGSSSIESFDVVDDKLVTNFRTGHVYIIYYAESTDDCGNLLIPDNYRIKEYIESYLKYKLFEQLYNSVTDESFAQIERKYVNYRQIYDENYIIAQVEAKKETTQDKLRKIRNSYNRFNDYNIE
jgi:hypothetical protein